MSKLAHFAMTCLYCRGAGCAKCDGVGEVGYIGEFSEMVARLAEWFGGWVMSLDAVAPEELASLYWVDEQKGDSK